MSVDIILQGRWVLKLPQIGLQIYTKFILNAIYLKHQFFPTLLIYYTFFNTESYLSVDRVTNIFMPKFTLILINLKYILYFIIQLQ